MATDLLPALHLRLVVDAATRCMLRLDANVVKPATLGWGLVAKIYPGGTLTLEQQRLPNGRWVVTHVQQDTTIREALVKVAHQRSDTVYSHFEPLPAALSVEQGVRLLLSTPRPTAAH